MSGFNSMLRNVLNFLWGSEWVAFQSDFDFDESVRRLAAVSKRPLFRDYYPAVLALKLAVAAGEVSAQRVYLWCERPFVRNVFRPVFVGWFQPVGTRVILVGQFTMTAAVGALLVFSFGFSVLVTVFATWELAKRPFDRAGWLLVVSAPAIFLFGLGVARLGKWLSYGDAFWLMTAIQAALRRDSTRVR